MMAMRRSCFWCKFRVMSYRDGHYGNEHRGCLIMTLFGRGSSIVLATPRCWSPKIISASHGICQKVAASSLSHKTIPWPRRVAPKRIISRYQARGHGHTSGHSVRAIHPLRLLRHQFPDLILAFSPGPGVSFPLDHSSNLHFYTGIPLRICLPCTCAQMRIRTVVLFDDHRLCLRTRYGMVRRRCSGTCSSSNGE